MVPAQDQPLTEGNPEEPTFMEQVQAELGADLPPESEETLPAEETPIEPVVPEEPKQPRHGEAREGAEGAEMFVKVDGRGDWIPMSEVADGFSFRRHNSREAQRIAKERKEMEDLKMQMLAQRPAPVAEAPDPDRFPPLNDDDFYSKPKDAVDRMINQRLDAITRPLQEKIDALEMERKAESKKLQFEREIATISTQPGLEDFDRGAVERYLSRMPDENARKYEHPLGYKLAWLELKNSGVNKAASKIPGPPAQERVSGPGPARRKMEIPDKITSTDDLAALLQNNLESFAQKK